MNNTFANIVADNFQEIQRNFKAGLRDKGYRYDEDIMNDAFISCIKSLKDRTLPKKEAIKYYWTAYINKYKTMISKNKLKYVDVLDDIDEEDEKYDDTIDEIYDIIISEVRDHFGLRKAYIWDLYVCQGKSAKEIRNMGIMDVDNFVYFTRSIKRYIQNHVIPKNKKLQELILNRKWRE